MVQLFRRGAGPLAGFDVKRGEPGTEGVRRAGTLLLSGESDYALRAAAGADRRRPLRRRNTRLVSANPDGDAGGGAGLHHQLHRAGNAVQTLPQNRPPSADLAEFRLLETGDDPQKQEQDRRGIRAADRNQTARPGEAGRRPLQPRLRRHARPGADRENPRLRAGDAAGTRAENHLLTIQFLPSNTTPSHLRCHEAVWADHFNSSKEIYQFPCNFYSKFSFQLLKKVRFDTNVMTQLIVHVTPLVWRKMNFQLTFFK